MFSYVFLTEQKHVWKSWRNGTVSGEVGKDMGEMIATGLLQCLQD